MFTGRYTTEQINTFVQNTDVLINLYENDRKQTLANTVKLYDGIRYGLPMLVTEGSYMAKNIGNNAAVYCFDLEKTQVDNIIQWYHSLSKSAYPYNKELSKIQHDDEIFRQKLLEFVKE